MKIHYIFSAFFILIVQLVSGSNVISLPWVVSDIKYSTVKGKLYAVVNAMDIDYGNHIIEINPATGEVEHATYVGCNPAFLRLTTDENYAWVSFSDIPYVRRVNLNTFIVDKDIFLGPTNQHVSPGYGFSTILAYNFAVLPHDNNSLVLGLKQPYDFAFDALSLYLNDTIQPEPLLDIPERAYPFCFEPVLEGSYLLGHYQSNLDNIFSRMQIQDKGLQFMDLNDSTAPAVFMRNFFKVHHDTVYNAEGYVLDATDSCKLRVLGQCKNDIIGDRYGFTFSEIHNAFVYPNLTDNSIYLTFYDRHTFKARDSVFLLEYPFNQLMMMLELEVIDKQHFAILIGKDYGDFTICIVETESNAIGERLADNNIQVLPNPATAQVVVRGLPQHCEISLYDISSRLLGTYSANGGQATLDVAGFPRGIILLKVLDLTPDGSSYITKIVVQ